MSKIKLPHASGNSMSIAAPATNPASDLELKLPATIGTAGQVLRNSSTAGTLEFGTLGKVLQVVQAETTTEESNSNSSYITWFSKAWTPVSSTSHKIITVHAIRLVVGQGLEANFRIYDGSQPTDRYRIFNDSVSGNLWLNPVISFYWTRSHTAGTQYTFSCQCRDGNGDGDSVTWGDNGTTSTMTIMEVEPS